MSQDINVQVKMPDNKVYEIKINQQATVQDALEKLIVDTKIMDNEYANESLFLLFELKKAKYSKSGIWPYSKLEPEPLYQLIEHENFTTTKIQDLIQTDKSILKLKLRVHDESTKIYNNIDKNLIVLKDIIPPESLNVTEFGKITDDASLLKFCQEKNEQKVKSYADYNKAQKIAFWNIIRNNILNVENKKLSLETVFEFHIFAFGNTRIDREDFSDELYGILNEHRPGIFWYPEYLNVPGYKIKDSEDKINSMKPIFDFIKQHRAKCKNRCNTLNYINLIDCFYDMCNEKFTWQDILDLNLIKLENADDFQKLGSDGLSSIINILGYCLCLSKNSNDKEAITAIKNIFANMSNSVVTLDQIVQLLNLCEKNKIDIEMDEKTVTKLFREIENDKRQLNKDELLKICSFCKDNSIPEESMKYVIEKYPSSDLLTPTFINYAKRKTKFNAGSDFNSVNSLAIYDIDWICENYDNNKKISYTKDDFIGLFSFINRKGLCVNVLSIQYYQSYRKRKSFGDMKNFANDILNDKNRINKSENKIIQNNKLTLAELHVIFFSDFSFDNESYDVTEQQFKNMIPDEIDFGYLKFLLLFYSERNKLTNENIIFCFEKYKIGIDENLDDLFKYLDDYYIKMLDEDKKNDLVCKLFDVYINNRKIQSSSDDFNKAKEAKNKYLTQEYLKTITEKENQHPIIDFNENKVSNNKIEIGNGNTYNQSDFIDLSKKNQQPTNAGESKRIDNRIENDNDQSKFNSELSNANDSSSTTFWKVIGRFCTLVIFIWIPRLFNIIFGSCCSCIKTGHENKYNNLTDSVKKNDRTGVKAGEKPKEKTNNRNGNSI